MVEMSDVNSIPCSEGDFKAIASLHKHSIPKGFLSSLGERFLSRLYYGISRHPQSCVLVERESKGKVVGFISGSISISKCYKHVIMHNFASLGVPIFFKLFSFSVIKKIKETLVYARAGKVESDKIDAELLSMAVSSKARGMGIGKKLISSLEDFFKENKFTGVYKVVTSAEDERSNGFYKSAGFKFYRKFMHHENLMHEYRKNVSGD
jgi:ribosomal protein S18 acetylase RimI-like enzyme